MSKHEEKHEHSVEHIKNPAMWHDTSEVNVRAVVGTLVVMVIAAVLIYALIAGMMAYFSRSYSAEEAQPNPMKTGHAVAGQPDPIRDFPQPQLQSDPVGERNKTAAEQELWLNTYGWIDKDAGVVHVPIQDAMEMLLQQSSSAAAPLQPGKPPGVYHPQNLPADYQEWK